MIHVEEHVYHDDPKAGHPDARTQLPGVCYYFIGNGLIAAAVQHAPNGMGSLYGLLLMDPQQLKTKREALSFDPETGIEKTMLHIRCPRTDLPLARNHARVCWDYRYGFAAIRVEWQTDGLEIGELLYCPDRSSPRIAREIQVRNRSGKPAALSVGTGVRSESIGRDVHLPPGGEAELCILYALDEPRQSVSLQFCDPKPPNCESRHHWSAATRVHFESPCLDHLFQSAAAQLPAMISRTGRIDAGIWQYNREWVRDQSLAAHAVLLCGHHELARVMLERLLVEFISEEGSTVDSSEVRDPEDAELDQNGTLLHVLREYALWTGDLGLIRANWDRIVRTAEFPLQPCFREPASGLMVNQRDYWERHAAYGIEPGMELMYQVYVSVGLSAAAELARQIEKWRDAERWRLEAERLKHAILSHPTHALVHEGGLFKRRGADGSVQERIIPKPGHGLPQEVGLARDIPHPLNPDSACALPILLGFVTPESDIARTTMCQLETLWNQGWESGGYGRYHMDSDPDSPGAWPFASLYIARAYLELRDYDKVWRVIHWLASLPEYPSGSYFEMYGNRISPPYAQNGIVPWNWAEIILLVVKNVLGFQPEENAIRVRPRLLPGLNCARGSIPFRDRRVFFDFHRDDLLAAPEFLVDSHPFETAGEGLRLPFSGKDIHIDGILPSARHERG
jgi:hypothetical protein